MTVIAELQTILTANNTDFLRGMKSAEREVNSFAASARTSFNSIAKLAAGTAAIAVYALGRSVNKTTEEISNLVDTSRRLGTSVASLQALQYAAEQSGIGAEGLNTALGKMLVNLGKAKVSGGEAAEAFTNIGLNAQQLSALAPDEQFLRISEALASIEDPAIRAEAAIAVFGKGGLSVLNGVQDDVRGLANEFKKMGQGLTNEQGDAVEAFGDSIKKTSILMQGLENQIVFSLATAFKPMLDDLTSNSEKMQQFAQAAKLAAEIIKVAFKGVLAVVKVVGVAIEGWKLAVDGAALAAGKLAEIRAKASLQDAKDMGNAEQIKKASQEYNSQVAFVKALRIEISKAAVARAELAKPSKAVAESVGPSGNSKANPIIQEIAAQKSLIEGYNKQLEVAKQAVTLQNQKVQGMRDEQALLNDLVESRGGELEKFKAQGDAAKKLQEELNKMKEDGPTAKGTNMFGKGRSLLDTDSIDSLIDKFKELQDKVNPEDLMKERLNEIQQAFNILTDPKNQFGAGNTDRAQQVELKVVVQAQEGLEARVAQSKANKDVIISTVNEQFNAAAAEIQR